MYWRLKQRWLDIAHSINFRPKEIEVFSLLEFILFTQFLAFSLDSREFKQLFFWENSLKPKFRDKNLCEGANLCQVKSFGIRIKHACIDNTMKVNSFTCLANISVNNNQRQHHNYIFPGRSQPIDTILNIVTMFQNGKHWFSFHRIL